MPKFAYNAIESSGRPVSGEVEADTAGAAIARLEADGLRVDSVRILGEPGGEAVGRPPHNSVENGRTSEKLTNKDFRELSGHISEITDAGLPLATGLAALSAEIPNGRLRRGLKRIVSQLESGADLATVLESHNAPADLRALIRAGVASGHMGQILGQYVSHSRHISELRRRAALGLGYPLVLLGLAVLLFVAFLATIVPQFKSIFEDFGTELPALTVSLIGLSNFLIDYGFLALVIGVPLAAVMWLMSYLLLDAPTRRRLVCHLPILGTLLRWSALARFSHLLAFLVENDVPLPEALRLAGDGVVDADIADASRYLADSVESGKPLTASAHAFSRFPSSFVQMLTWEKRRDAFPEALHAVADMFEGRARVQGAFVAVWCEPFIVMLTGGALMYLVVGLFLPLVKLLNDLS